MQQSWQLEAAIDAVIFDCDGTLSHIEGINELAKACGVEAPVSELTRVAMAQTGISAELYAKRLALVQPSKAQLGALAQRYFRARTPDCRKVLAILQTLNKPIFIISAGLNPAVRIFGECLGILPQNIYAVETYFDDQGNYTGYDENNPLTKQGGKLKIVAELKKQYPRLLHVGDGMNDIESLPLVTRFVGYGGAFFHEQIEKRCSFYIKVASLLPLLPLCLTATEVEKLTLEQKQFYFSGCEMMHADGVIMHTPSLD